MAPHLSCVFDEQSVRGAIAKVLTIAKPVTHIKVLGGRGPILMVPIDTATQACIAEASDYYHVKAAQIQEIIANGLSAGVERSGRVGPMAIPVQWLPIFELMGISPEAVAHNACENVLAGTWILAYMDAIKPALAASVDSPRGRYEGRFPASLESLRRHWAPVVTQASTVTGVPAALIDAVISVESRYQPRARSGKSAIGMMQLIESTASMLGGDPWDPVQNIQMGARYLAQLARQFNGDLPLTLAAYNAGPGAVTKNGYRVPPYPETMAYVPMVIARYQDLMRR